MGCDVEERTQPRSILCEAKKRRQVEEDATRLRNRILQLERQADKADKRIWHTKQRAKDVLDQRERNERRERERQRLLAQLQQEVQQHRTDITRCAPTFRRDACRRMLRYRERRSAAVCCWTSLSVQRHVQVCPC